LRGKRFDATKRSHKNPEKKRGFFIPRRRRCSDRSTWPRFPCNIKKGKLFLSHICWKGKKKIRDGKGGEWRYFKGTNKIVLEGGKTTVKK